MYQGIYQDQTASIMIYGSMVHNFYGNMSSEIKTEIKLNALMMEVGVLEKLETSISSWIKLVRVV